MGDIDNAMTETWTAAQTEPYNPDVQAEVGDKLRLLGDLPDARKAYERALALDAANEQAQLGLLVIERGPATAP